MCDINEYDWLTLYIETLRLYKKLCQQWEDLHNSVRLKKPIWGKDQFQLPDGPLVSV